MKNLFSILSLFFCYSLIAQQEVTFDLNTSKFSKKLSYIEKVTFVGEPKKDGVQFDVIDLEIRSLDKNIEKKLSEENKKLRELKIEIESLSSQLEMEGDTSTQGKVIIGEKEELVNAQKKLQLSINDLEKKKYKKIENVRWVRVHEDDKFSLPLAHNLTMVEDYEFEFTGYTKSTEAFPSKDLMNRLTSELTKELKKGSVSGPNFEQLIQKGFDTVLTTFFGGKTLFVNNTISQYDGSFLHKDTIVELYSKLIPILKTIADEENDLNKNIPKLKTKISALKASQYGIDQSAFSAEFELSLKGFSYNDLDKWLDLAKKNGLDSALAVDSVWNNSIMIKIIGSNENILLKKDEMQPYEKGVDSLMAISVNNLYSKEVFKHKIASTAESTELDATLIGTMYGIGALYLDDDIWELTQYITLNFRWGPYDNRLKGKAAYKSFWSRCSIMFGMGITDNMEYKGQKLQNTRLGIKPILGLSFEPMKHLNISAGAMAFIQEPVSGDQSYSVTHFRPMISIAFDFNAVNFLITKNKE